MEKITPIQKVTLGVYSFLTSTLSVIVLPVIFILRLILGKDVSSWKIKFGNYKNSLDKNKKTIVIHGVSVGEVVSLEKLIRKIKETFPNCNLIITTGTKTGQETAIKKMSDVADFITYFPLDLPICVEKFLNEISPNVVLMAETEVWPIFALGCHKKEIPLYIINGRISDSSYKSYKFLKPFFKCVLPLYSGVFTQSEIDKERFENLGAKKETLHVMKNLKFDVKKFDTSLDLKSGNSKVLIAGSTHTGEDETVLSVFKKLKTTCPNLKLLLAPRHITRVKKVEELIKKAQFTYNLYSVAPNFQNADILLLDVMGELAKLYSACDIAFIGGSFNKTGGHNPLEASIFDKPVISGSSIKNFRDIYAILTRNNAAFIAKNENEFFNFANKLLTNPSFYENAKKNAAIVFENQKGALDFVINKLKEVV